MKFLINLKTFFTNYTAPTNTHPPLTTDANPDGKRCLTVSKLIKESRKQFDFKKLVV
jgi:hypothetical protein